MSQFQFMVSKAPNQCRIKCFLEQMGFSDVDGGGSFYLGGEQVDACGGFELHSLAQAGFEDGVFTIDWSCRQVSRRKWFRIRGLEPDNFLKDFLKELSPIPRAMTERAELCSD
jgi:hypothetical protein